MSSALNGSLVGPGFPALIKLCLYNRLRGFHSFVLINISSHRFPNFVNRWGLSGKIISSANGFIIAELIGCVTELATMIELGFTLTFD